MSAPSTPKSYRTNFNEAACKPNPELDRPAPFSLRLSRRERQILEDQAGNQPLGAFIRERLFGEDATKRRKSRKPRVDEQKLAQVLAELGRSRLSSNLNQLAKSANIGTIDVRDDVEAQLEEAAQAVLAMRDCLFIALGLRPGHEK